MDEFVVKCRGTRFTLSKEQIEFDSPNFFSTCFLQENGYTEGESKTVTVRSHPLLFELIIEFMSGYDILPLAPSAIPRTMTTETAYQNLLKDAQYYGLDGLVKLLKMPKLSDGHLALFCNSDVMVHMDELKDQSGEIWENLCLSERGLAMNNAPEPLHPEAAEDKALTLLYLEDSHLCILRLIREDASTACVSTVCLPKKAIENIQEHLHSKPGLGSVVVESTFVQPRWATVPSIVINGKPVPGNELDDFLTEQDGSKFSDLNPHLCKCWPIDDWPSFSDTQDAHPSCRPKTVHTSEHFRTCAQVEAVYLTLRRRNPDENILYFQIEHIRLATRNHSLTHTLSYTNCSYASAQADLLRSIPQVVTVEGPVEVQATGTPLRTNLVETETDVNVTGAVDIDNTVTVEGPIEVDGTVNIRHDEDAGPLRVRVAPPEEDEGPPRRRQRR